VLFHAVLAPVTALHALLYKREPRASFGWIAVCVLFPLAGPILYLLFGLNRARERAQRLVFPRLEVGYERGAVIPVRALPAQLVRTPYRELARIGQALSRHEIVARNRVDPLFDGEAAYPAMLEAIGQAGRQVFLATYILDHDRTGQDFITALMEATRRGVDVLVLIDGVGEWYSRPRASRRLARAGIRVARFLPPRLLPPSLSINLRNHHKILVVDGQVAFTGGMNISDRHCVRMSDNPSPTQDVHFRLLGPVVEQLAEEFVRSWKMATEERIEVCPASVVGNGELNCRTVTDGPDEDLDRLSLLLTAAISAARHSIFVMTPYFLPPREIIGALQAAALRGVDVVIVLPQRSNLRYVDWATRNMLWELLFRGIRVHYQPGPFNHGKLLVVDGYYSLIGSTNWDPRSLRLNFELQVEVYGEAFATDLVTYIESRARAGRAVTLQEVDRRGLATRLRDSLCWLFSPYL